MKKLLIIIFSFIITSGSFAFAEGDLWDNYGDQNIYGQKPVSDKEFEQALESKKGKKKRDKNIPKGESFQQSNETNSIINTSKELPVLLIPLNLKCQDGSIIPTGHYQVEGVKENGKTFLKLYQAHYVIAKLPAFETNEFWHGNITHNLCRMAEDCMSFDEYDQCYNLYDLLWRDTQAPFEGNYINVYIAHLAYCLYVLKNDPEYFKQFNPPNGWGTYEQLCQFTEDFIKALITMPEGSYIIYSR